MRNPTPLFHSFVLFLLVSFTGLSCSKSDSTVPASREDLVLGKWNINRMQLKVYSGGVFIKDTIIKQTPKPENFVNFGSTSGFEYRFNTSTSDIGTYRFSGADSLIAVAGSKTYRWKMLTLTKDLFTVVTTSTTDAYYPGALVENYQTFVRYK